MTTEVQNAIEEVIYETTSSLRTHDFMAEEPMDGHEEAFRDELGREPTEEEMEAFEEEFVEEAEAVNSHRAGRWC